MALSSIKKINFLNLLRFPKNYNSYLTQRLQSSKAANGKEARSAECSKPPQPKCGVRFKNEPCEIKRAKPAKLPQPAPPSLPQDKVEIKIKRSVYCCGDPCPDALPRFDKLYYRRSDKAERDYQQTWNECPEQFIRPKVICCHKPIKPKFKKRPRKERPKTACKADVCLQSKTKCPYIKMPDCKEGRKPPSCLTQRKPAKCLKRNPPYPSFSECKRVRPKGRHPIECKCLAIPSICEVWAYHHRQAAIKKPESC
ncbi:uncharacterized protein LOC119606528 [Lucilia sericata]|uniref:uncharacterized protein LOC119606528 n=1 Tax=Lucilia sericata TaxID=13632 RepID=UPI0018A817AD|nr:uncharacterized protein LOC119606528 [Lucilia sericata]